MPVELLAKEVSRRETAPLYRGYAFDLDGTLYLGDHLIEGADVVVAALRDSGARVVFVTNKPLETADAYAAKLTKLGIPAVAEDVISALDALTLYLTGRHPGARILAVGEPVLIESLRRTGFTVTENPRRPTSWSCPSTGPSTTTN